ncbi:excinuclease ABC subunit UvrA [Candidatus Dependentiae bacterium]|nr:excinuclease ABC subunit UvrA [Candidatus Dependentiae bacterium]
MQAIKSNKNRIKVIGAREHNLKNITVEIPKDALTVITGPSGSGKSSLALDILYTEGKRRYIESLSSYARQFLGLPKKPDVDSIEGLCPAIAIDQKTVGSNPRSTVGTITETYDYMRVLFARNGTIACPDCKSPISAESPDKIANLLVTNFDKQTVIIAAPIAHYQKGEFVRTLEKLFATGYYKFIIDGQRYNFRKLQEIQELKLKKTERHSIDVLLDACEVTETEASRLQDSIERSFSLAQGVCKVIVGDTEHMYAAQRMCLRCNYSFPEVEPRLFSFNSPIGACRQCHGLGMVYAITTHDTSSRWYRKKDQEDESKYANLESEEVCSSCNGQRLNKAALAVTIEGKNIYDLGQLSVKKLALFFNQLKLSPIEQSTIGRLVQEITTRVQFLCDVGLGYLSLNRTARTLSGGEGQRIRLATQIGSALSGVLYILDEPSIGLHQRDNDKLIGTLHALRDLGNTVVVVEHDTDTMMQSDYIIDMGPGAGVGGGYVVAAGTPQEISDNLDSLTGAYLSGRKCIEVPHKARTPKSFITLKNANTNNLKDLTIKFPLGVLCGISGVSGSGKSTLIMQELVPALQAVLKKRSRIPEWMKKMFSGHEKLEGAEKIENLVVIDQTPIGRTPRSTPATYLGIFDDIRALFAGLPESNARGYKVGRFSFNVAEGRCSHCAGEGTVTIAMHFLADVSMICHVCQGTRYNIQTREIKYKSKNIAQVLDMTAAEAVVFFEAHRSLHKKLRLMCDVGLDYIKLGQSSITLSGGEAQRIKLASELAKRGTNTLYILDEPTTGLHSSDIDKLLKVLQNLIDKGNSLLVIEHNLDVLKTADYIIDLGPEGGEEGGTLVAQGTPKEIAHNKQSYTGNYLKRVL